MLARIFGRGTSSGSALAVARSLFAARDYGSAKGCCETALRTHPDDIDVRELLACSELELGSPKDAIRNFRLVLDTDITRSSAWREIARAYALTGDRLEAMHALRRSCDLAPQDVDAWVKLASLLAESGDLADAEHALMQCICTNPESAQSFISLGVVRLKRLDWSGARAAFESALAYEPESVAAAKHLAFVLEISGEPVAAAERLEQAIAFGDVDANLLVQAARVARRCGNPARSGECATRALELDERCAEAHFLLGSLRWDRGDTGSANAAFRAAFDIDPEHAPARWALAITEIPSLQVGNGEATAQRFAAQLTQLDAWMSDDRARRSIDAIASFTPFFLAYIERDNSTILSQYGDLCARVVAAHRRSRGDTATPARSSDDRSVLRLGIVSAHFHDHSVWHALLKGWFLHLDKQQVELYAYSLKSVVDNETRIAMAHASKFVQLANRDHDSCASTIVADDLDALIYPEIGMTGVAVQLACRRIAPIQMAAWGHPETSGLPEIDYFLSAADFEPANGREFYREKLVVLPKLGVCFAPAESDAADIDLSAIGLSKSRPVILLPGTPFKYAPHNDSLIVEIARRVPHCQIVIFNDERDVLGAEFRHRLESAFAASEIQFADHVVVLPWLDQTRWQALLRQSTVMLDTIGFSGFNTASQALACNLPVVAWDGRFMRGRLASGLLRRMGLHEWIAGDAEQYVSLTKRLCDDTALQKRVSDRIAACKAIAFGDVEPVRKLEEFLLDRFRNA